LWIFNEFTSKVIEMKANNQQKLLVLYFSVLSKSTLVADCGIIEDMERESVSLQSYIEV
jgi:hypothetical protein